MSKYFLSFLLLNLMLSCSDNNSKSSGNISTKPEKILPVTGKHTSIGSLSFKLNGELFTADASNAKAWASPDLPLGMLVARNKGGLLVSIQIHNLNGKGRYKIDSDSNGATNFTVNGTTYWTKSGLREDYIDVEITDIKEQYTVLLLSGTFSGVLEDQAGNKVQITEGTFTTEKI